MKLTRRKLKCSGKNLSQCCFVHHISHTDCSGVKPGLHGETPLTNHVCCVTPFVTVRHKFNVNVFMFQISRNRTQQGLHTK